MNTIHLYGRQTGFFDLGLSLVLLAIFGTTAYILAPSSEGEESEQSETHLQQKQIATCEDERNNKNQIHADC